MLLRQLSASQISYEICSQLVGVNSHSDLRHLRSVSRVLIEGGVSRMSEIEVRKNESFESALRRFKKKIDREGILRELRDRKHYEKPSEKRRRRYSIGSRSR